MPTKVRVYRTTIDASPNEMATNSNSDYPFGLKEFTCNNTDNSTDVYISFYQETSGSTTVGTTTPVYGPKLVPAQAELTLGGDDPSNPLASFNNAITVAVTTTKTGSTSPTSDCAVELHYWRY